jgi:hypothetical protein
VAPRDRRSVPPPHPLSWVGELLAKRRQDRLTSGLWDGRQPRRALTPERPVAAEQIAGRPPGGGIDVGRWAHAAAEQDGDRVGIALVLFRVAPRAGLPVEGIPQYEGPPVLSAEAGQPGPR